MIEQAEDLARSAADPHHQSDALLAVLRGLLITSNVDQGIERVAELAATAAEQIVRPTRALTDSSRRQTSVSPRPDPRASRSPSVSWWSCSAETPGVERFR